MQARFMISSLNLEFEHQDLLNANSKLYSLLSIKQPHFLSSSNSNVTYARLTRPSFFASTYRISYIVIVFLP